MYGYRCSTEKDALAASCGEGNVWVASISAEIRVLDVLLKMCWLFLGTVAKFR
jgi:hypothetical protein